MSRLATALRRIRFVILRTAGSPPVAPHPASRRRSFLRLRSQRPAPTRTCTVLTKRPHGAHSCPRKRAPRANAPDAALGSRLRGCNRFPILDVTVSSVRQLNLNALGAGCLTTAGRIGGGLQQFQNVATRNPLFWSSGNHAMAGTANAAAAAIGAAAYGPSQG